MAAFLSLLRVEEKPPGQRLGSLVAKRLPHGVDGRTAVAYQPFHVCDVTSRLGLALHLTCRGEKGVVCGGHIRSQIVHAFAASHLESARREPQAVVPSGFQNLVFQVVVRSFHCLQRREAGGFEQGVVQLEEHRLLAELSDVSDKKVSKDCRCKGKMLKGKVLKVVNSFPDFTIKFVESFPGVK